MPDRRGQHLGLVAVLLDVGRPGEADAGRDAAAGLISLDPGQDAEGNLARPEGRNPGRPLHLDATGRQDRRDGDNILLLDVRIAESIFKCSQALAMNAYASGQEEVGRDGKHSEPRCGGAAAPRQPPSGRYVPLVPTLAR